MGGRGSGRTPLPTAVKKLRGNPGHRPLNDGEPKPAAGEPEMPEGLSAAAAAEWKAIVPQLLALGVLSVLDGAALAGYCHCFARWQEAEREIERRGLLVDEPIVDKDGEVVGYRTKRNPAIIISESSQKLMKLFLVEFGLTPASRARLKIDPHAGEVDPFDEYLAGATNSLEPN